MMLYNRILKGLYHVTVYCIGIVVLVSAVAVTMVRLALPDIGEYRGEVEAWVSRYMGYPIVIHSLEASWEGWIPHLYLTDVDLLNRSGTHKISGFSKARIEIDPVKTLIERQFIPRHLLLSGFQLSVARLPSGAIFIEGVNIGETGTHNERSEFAEWLFKQDRVEIQDVGIKWIDVKHDQEPILLSDVSLILRSDGDRIQMEGSCDLPLKYGKSMNFAFDAVGDLLTADWSGDLYLEASDINPDNWYKNYRPSEISIAGGNANIRVWSTWLDTRLFSMEGTLVYNDFAARSGSNSLHVEELAYGFKGERHNDKDWHFRINLENLLTENGYWPESDFEIAAVRSLENMSDYRFAFSFDFLKIEDLLPLITTMEIIPSGVRKSLLDGNISGELRRGLAVYERKSDAPDVFYYDLAIDNLSTKLGSNLPGISGFSGSISGTQDSALINFTDANAGFSLPGLSESEIRLENINGTVFFENTGTEWMLSTQMLTLGNRDYTVKLSGDLRTDIKLNKPELNIFADLRSDRIEKLHEIIPELENFRMSSWLQRAVQGGQLDSAQFVFRGDPASFPFRDNDGQFQGLASVSDVVLEYSPKWPVTDALAAEIRIANEKLSAKVVNGNIFNAGIEDADVTIEDITRRPRVVAMQGRITGAIDDLLTFIAESPLRSHQMLTHVRQNLSGRGMLLDLDLLIPIRTRQVKPRITGTLALEDAVLQSTDRKIRLSGIAGPVTFTGNSVSGRDLQAEFDGLPVSLTIDRPPEKPEVVTSLRINGSSGHEFIIRQLKTRFKQLEQFASVLAGKLAGELDWQAEISFIREGEDLRNVLTLSSDLHGLAVELPAPAGKSRWDRKRIEISKDMFTGNEMLLVYDDTLRAGFINDTETSRLQAIRVVLGDGMEIPANVNTRGLSVYGSVDTLSFRPWLDTVREFAHNDDEKAGFIAKNNIDIALQINDFEFYKHHFTGIEITANRMAGTWYINPSSTSVDGEITLPARFTDNSVIRGLFSKLAIPVDNDNRAAGSVTDFDPGLFPALDIQADEFKFRDMHLGRLDLVASRTDTGLEFQTVSLAKPDMTISGSGTWNKTGLAHNSSFTLELNAEEINSMLETFKYDVTAINKGKTGMIISADWPGSPMDFSLEKMNGTLDLIISKGQILEVDPSAGRLFGLLSIQTLPRRLSLDFSDLLGKGLAFDEISGSFNISQGNAYTNDLHLTGPAADVSVSGRTGLAQQDYDQIVTVTPQVANTLPVASALFGPVGIGVGAVLYLAGNMFESINNSIDNLLSYQYTITGPWQNPVIEKIKSRGNEENSDNKLSKIPGILSSPSH